MICAIQLVLDDNAQVKINEIRKKLVAQGVHDEAVPINHISLAELEFEEDRLEIVKNILKNFAKKHNKVPLSLVSMGSFMTNENVIYLAPVMTEQLCKYNQELVKVLTKAGIKCGKYYTKDNWQPHCTLVLRISDEEFLNGIKVLKENNILPLNFTGVKVDLLRFDPKPYEELACFQLK